MSWLLPLKWSGLRSILQSGWIGIITGTVCITKRPWRQAGVLLQHSRNDWSHIKWSRRKWNSIDFVLIWQLFASILTCFCADSAAQMATLTDCTFGNTVFFLSQLDRFPKNMWVFIVPKGWILGCVGDLLIFALMPRLGQILPSNMRKIKIWWAGLNEIHTLQMIKLFHFGHKKG